MWLLWIILVVFVFYRFAEPFMNELFPGVPIKEAFMDYEDEPEGATFGK